MDIFSNVQLPKVTARLPSSWPFRHIPTTAQAEGSQPPGKQTYSFKTLPRSNTNPFASGGAEPRNDHEAEHTNTTRPPTVNVVLFGETGVGKSSVINLIARRAIAEVSSDVNGCTMQSTRYDIPFDDMSFSIFDTIGLEEPQMGVNGYLKAIEKAYELISKLSVAGGIHLLLFCMRGGRITATTQSNYRLFCECLCSTKVPIALVFTGLEREVEMEDWWERNKKHIEHYGIKSNGHACITAVQDDTPGEDLKFTESQKRIRELLKDCALKNEAFLLESHSWFARLGRGMKSFIAKRRNPKKRDIMKVLTQRCKLDYDTARKIVDMMEKEDPETKDQVAPAATEGSEDPLGTHGNGEDEAARDVMTDDPEMKGQVAPAATGGSEDPLGTHGNGEGEAVRDAMTDDPETRSETNVANVMPAADGMDRTVGSKRPRKNGISGSQACMSSGRVTPSFVTGHTP